VHILKNAYHANLLERVVIKEHLKCCRDGWFMKTSENVFSFNIAECSTDSMCSI
jgi:hypothetical protein